jgi:hypothetical protein
MSTLQVWSPEFKPQSHQKKKKKKKRKEKKVNRVLSSLEPSGSYPNFSLELKKKVCLKKRSSASSSPELPDSEALVWVVGGNTKKIGFFFFFGTTRV